MNKFIYQTASLGVLCLAISYQTLAQTVTAPAPGPPPPPVVKAISPDKSDQKEIIIRQKGDKDTKITLEIKNGDLFINGKPADKFDDKDIIIEKRDISDDEVIDIPELSYTPSPFREHEWEDAARVYQRSELDGQRRNLDAQRKMMKSVRVRMNEAFLGVSSKKTDKEGASGLEVTKGSPSEKAGILKGDLMIRCNETNMTDPANA